MMFRTDCGGAALKADIKISAGASTWNTRLSQIGKTNNDIIIVTYTLNDYEYIKKIISKRYQGMGITILCNSKFLANAYHIKSCFPEIKMFANPNVHAKMVLLEPRTVWVSSENLGYKKKSFDATVGISNIDAYKHFYAQVKEIINCADTVEIKGGI